MMTWYKAKLEAERAADGIRRDARAAAVNAAHAIRRRALQDAIDASDTRTEAARLLEMGVKALTAACHRHDVSLSKFPDRRRTK